MPEADYAKSIGVHAPHVLRGGQRVRKGLDISGKSNEHAVRNV